MDIWYTQKFWRKKIEGIFQKCDNINYECSYFKLRLDEILRFDLFSSELNKINLKLIIFF